MDTFLTGMGDAIAQAVMLGLTLSFLAAISVGVVVRHAMLRRLTIGFWCAVAVLLGLAGLLTLALINP